MSDRSDFVRFCQIFRVCQILSDMSDVSGFVRFCQMCQILSDIVRFLSDPVLGGGLKGRTVGAGL